MYRICLVFFHICFLVSCVTKTADEGFRVYNATVFPLEIRLESLPPIIVPPDGNFYIDDAVMKKTVKSMEFIAAKDVRFSLFPVVDADLEWPEQPLSYYFNSSGVFKVNLPEWTALTKDNKDIMPKDITEVNEKNSYIRKYLEYLAWKTTSDGIKRGIDDIGEYPSAIDIENLGRVKEELGHVMLLLEELNSRSRQELIARAQSGDQWDLFLEKITLLRVNMIIMALEVSLIRRQWDDFAFYRSKMQEHDLGNSKFNEIKKDFNLLKEEFNFLNDQKDQILLEERQRLLDYEEILEKVRSDNPIIAEGKLYRYHRHYGKGMFTGYDFLKNRVNEKMDELPWFKLGFGLQIQNNLALNHDSALPYGSRMGDEALFHANNIPFIFNIKAAARTDFILKRRFTLGLDISVGWSFYPLGDTFENFYYNANLVNNLGNQITALNKIRYTVDRQRDLSNIDDWWNIMSLGFNMQYRWGAGSLIFIPGISFMRTKIKKFELEKGANTDIWRENLENYPEIQFSIDTLYRFSFDFSLGYGLYMHSDRLKIEFLYGFSFIPSGDGDSYIFSKEIPPMDQYLQTMHSIKIMLYYYPIDSNTFRRKNEDR